MSVITRYIAILLGYVLDQAANHALRVREAERSIVCLIHRYEPDPVVPQRPLSADNNPPTRPTRCSTGVTRHRSYDKAKIVRSPCIVLDPVEMGFLEEALTL